MVGTFRKERRWEERNQAGGLLPVTRVFGYDICLCAVISITPAWTRGDMSVEEIEEEAEKEEVGEKKDERIQKLWDGMEMRSWTEKKKG